MGRIIGNRKETEKLYTLVEVNEITNELNAKIVELTETKEIKKSKKDEEKASE